jgi:polysaccharide pyruvyl transferase WcaK-like protein
MEILANIALVLSLVSLLCSVSVLFYVRGVKTSKQQEQQISQEISQAVEDGYLAAKAGWDITGCPYDQDDDVERYAAWFRGFNKYHAEQN